MSPYFCADDGEIGPVSRCRSFDFTVTFEHSILDIVPSVVFLLFASKALLQRSPARHIFDTRLPNAFTSVSFSLCAIASLLALVSWLASYTSIPPVASHIVTAALSISFFASILQAFLVSRTPVLGYTAFYLSLFRTLTLVLDVPQIRTFFIGRDSISSFFFATLLLKYALEFVSLVSLNLPRLNDDHSAENAGFLSRLFALWALPLIWKERREKLRVEDLPILHPSMASTDLFLRFEHAWKGETKRKPSSPSITRALMRAFYSTLLGVVIPGTIRALAQGIQPILVFAAIRFIESYSGSNQTPQPAQYGWALVGAFALVFFSLAAATCVYFYYTYQSATVLRGALSEAIYRKSLTLSAADTASGNCGNPVSLMSSDIERIVTHIDPFHQMWASCVVVALGLYILFNQLGLAFLAAVVSTLVLALILQYLGRPIGRLAMGAATLSDARVSVISNLLYQIKGIKLSAYEPLAIKKVAAARAAHLIGIRNMWRQLAKVVFMTNTLSNVLSLATLGAYSIISLLHDGTDLLGTARLFTAYAVMSVIAAPLLQVGQYYPGVINAYRSLKRIEQYLSSPEVIFPSSKTSFGPHSNLKNENRELSDKESSDLESDNSAEKGSSSDMKLGPSASLPHTLSHVVFQGASIGWGEKTVLEKIDAEIPLHKLVMVVGGVASGKSTLLATLLQETTLIHGRIVYPWSQGSVAYCPQKPWLQPSISIAENIRFVSEPDAAWYDIVTRACGLDVDFAHIHGGDSSLAKGLSGGQQARIGLARAIFSKRDVLILDDSFSALDSKTSKFVFNALFGPQGLLREKSVILATNQLSLLHHSHWLIALGDSKITAQGTYNSVFESPQGIEPVLHDSLISSNPAGETPRTESVVSTVDENIIPESSGLRQSGSMGLETYLHYCAAAGYWRMAIYAALAILTVGIQVSVPAYLQFWGAFNDSHQNMRAGQRGALARYLGGYAAIEVAYSTSFAVLFYYVVLVVTQKASTKLHADQVTAIMRSPLSFFSKTTAGQIISRFSQDFTIIDDEFPLALYDLSYQALTLIGSAVLLIVAVPFLAIVVVVVVFLGYTVQKMYLSSSRQRRRLDLETRSPLYQHLEESTEISGLFVIRAASAQAHVTLRYTSLLATSLQAFHHTNEARVWLTTMITLLTAVINTFIMVIAVILRRSTSSSLLGVGLTQGVALQEAVSLMLISWALMEISGVALERNLEYSRLTPEEAAPSLELIGHSDGGWKKEGSVTFTDVVARYSPDSQPALKGVSFHVKPGCRLGICGRTGSGKSTVILALVRALYTEGEIKVGGRNTNGLPLARLRETISVVAQDTFILDGTVRENIDFSGNQSDDRIWETLEAVQLKHVISAFPGQLDEPLSSRGRELSHGQAQLLELGRALLGGNKIVVLDEATANLDTDTDMAVQRLIRMAFEGVTIITVAHRIGTISDYDEVIVLDHGLVAERGRPCDLLKDTESLFSRMAVAQ